MLSLNHLAKVIIGINCFIIVALLMAWLTPLSFRVEPRFFPLLALFCLAFCLILALVAFLAQRLGHGSSWRINRFFSGALLSGFTFLFSLVLAYAVIPPFDNIYDLARIHNFFLPHPTGNFNEEYVIPSSHGKDVKLVCFQTVFDRPASGIMTVDRLFVFRQKLLKLTSTSTACIYPNPDSEKPNEQAVNFIWSVDGKYLEWSEKPPKYIENHPVGRIRVY